MLERIKACVGLVQACYEANKGHVIGSLYVARVRAGVVNRMIEGGTLWANDEILDVIIRYAGKCTCAVSYIKRTLDLDGYVYTCRPCLQPFLSQCCCYWHWWHVYRVLHLCWMTAETALSAVPRDVMDRYFGPDGICAAIVEPA
jgi:hypothetical protein